MPRVEWNASGKRLFEAGLDRGVLFPKVGPPVAWNGLVSVSEDPTGGDVEPLYFDGKKYLDLVSAEDFSAQVEAFSAPAEFNAAEGVKQLAPGLFVGNQLRETFALSYRTLIGNDLVGEEYGYKIHLIYNCTAAPSGRKHQTVANTADPQTRSWSITTVPPASSIFRPTAHLVVDSTKTGTTKLAGLEEILYGTNSYDGYLPTVAQVIAALT